MPPARGSSIATASRPSTAIWATAALTRGPQARAPEMPGNWKRTGPLRLELPTHSALSRATCNAAHPPIPRDPRDKPRSPLGICWAAIGFARKSGAKPPLALHHLVTALSVKKALLIWLHLAGAEPAASAENR